MFKKNNSIISSVSSIYSNIFKQSKSAPEYILNQTNKNINYDKINGNILKTFFKREQFDLELFINLQLNEMKLNIIPDILDIDDSTYLSSIKYNTDNMSSLREILLKNKINFHYVINELVSFLKYIKKNKVVVCNLHVDNIYINIKTMKFYIIDLTSIYIYNEESYISNNLDFQSLSMSMSQLNLYNDYFTYETSIYTKDSSKTDYISNLIDMYIYN